MYVAIIAIVGGAMIYQLATRMTAGISVLHDRQPLFVTLSDGSIRNAYTVRLLNKRPDNRQFALTIDAPPGAVAQVVGAVETADWRPIVEVGPDRTLEIRLLITMPKDAVKEKSQLITIKASDLFAGEVVSAVDHFIGPGS